MPFSVVALILFGTTLHASYHAFGSRAANRAAYFYWAIVIALLVQTAVVLTLKGLVLPSGHAALLLLLSATAETVNIFAISRAYSGVDLSVVYPLSRGSSPLFVALISAIVLKEHLSALGMLGVAAIVAGILWVGLRGTDVKAIGWKPYALVAASGLCIGAYSAVYKALVPELGPAWLNVYCLLSIVLLMGPLVLRRSSVEASPWNEWKQRRNGIVLGGFAIAINSFAGMWGLSLAPAAYVAAVRGSGTVISALIGWLVFREAKGHTRFAGATAIGIGIACLAFAS
jgi:drug/metabolite transporter (DMT)-like permease